MQLSAWVARGLADRGARVAWTWGAVDPELAAALAACEIPVRRLVSPASAGFAAGASAQLGGVLGVLIAPAADVELVPVLAAARADRAPIVALTPEPGGLDAPSYPAFCKAALSLGGGAAVADLADALALAAAERPGPVALALSAGAAAGSVGAIESPAVGEPPESLVERVRGWKRPVILAGFGARRAAVARLAEALDAPVLTSAKAKGVLPEELGWSAGALGLVAEVDAVHARLLARADGVLLVGWDVARSGRPWPAHLPVAWVDGVPPGFGLDAGDAWLAPPALACGALAAALLGGASQWDVLDIGDHRAICGDTLDEVVPLRGALAAVAAVRAALGGGDVASADGNLVGPIAQVWRCDRPDRLLVHGDRTVAGFALPAAIAAADAGRRAVALTDDANLARAIAELGAAADAGLAPVVVSSSGRDWSAVARGFGAEGHVVGGGPELTAAVRELLAQDRRCPAVLSYR